MAEHIEKQGIYDAVDLLMTKFPHKIPGRPDTYSKYNEAYCDACSDVLSIIENFPPADVRPVVKGRWIEDESGVVICSNCGEEHEWDNYRANFCDTCGADMRGGDAE